jgi:drug/metabolite transporter (DMT)-like permease
VTESIDKFQTITGSAAVLASAFCFYLSTATIRWAQLRGVTPDPAFYVLTRFLLGFLVITTILLLKKRSPRPIKYHLLVGRALANCVAVYCFYMAVQTTSVAHANILNMTYPVFVALITWGFLHEKLGIPTMFALLAAFAGIVLILHPGDMTINVNHLWGLSSGISAALAIIYLNRSRKVHDSETVLFYMFGLGSLFIYVGFHECMVLRHAIEIVYLLLCGAFGIAGQYLITLGFRYVTAVEGSILSSTRILIAAFAGPLIAMDPALTAKGWIGAVLIFTANVYLAFYKSSPMSERARAR